MSIPITLRNPFKHALLIIIVWFISYQFLTDNESIIINNNQLTDKPPASIDPLESATQLPSNQATFKAVTQDISYHNYHSRFGPLPKSLKDTHIPVHFKLEQDGQLVVTRSIRSLIEYFLSANSEESITTIVGRISELFDNALQEPARSQAKEVMRQYIDYKQALIQIERQLSDEQSLSGNKGDYQTVLQYRKEAREKYLSREIYDAFFAKDDSQDNYTAGMLMIRKNHALTDEEKQQQALVLESSLPPEEQAIKKAQHQRETLQQDIVQARASGASEADVFQMRSQIYDQETAERFALSDQKKAIWDARFAHYREQRQGILMGEGMTDADKENEIQALQDELFNHNEQRRLATLDRMADNQVQ